MREYGKVSPTFWTGTTGRALRARGTEAVVVGFYLMTAPGSNMLGLYYQPILYMAHETGLGFEGASKGLAECVSEGFCRYDQNTEMVWVVEMAAWQVAEKLKASDNRCAGIQRDYDALQANPFLGEFFDRYQAAFHLTERRGGEGAPKPLPSKEKEKEKEKEQEQEKEQASSLRSDSSSQKSDDTAPTLTLGNVHQHPASERLASIVLTAYHETLPNCQHIAVLNPKRQRRIQAADKLARQVCKQQNWPYDTKDFWSSYFGECLGDPWLRGDVPNPNNPRWKQNLDVLLAEDRFAEIMDKAIASMADAA